MTLRGPGALIGVLLAALLAACAAPGTRIVLLPQTDGRASAVVVRTEEGESLLSRPFERATALRGVAGAPLVDQVDPAAVRAANRSLFDLAPARAQRYTVYFDAGGTVLTAGSQEVMTEALVAGLARTGGDIVVTGYTDTIGNGQANDDLSRRRAQQVRQMFIDQKFPSQRIEAVGRGERELAISTADETDEPANRRVIIEIR